jgi:hypothetical protein
MTKFKKMMNRIEDTLAAVSFAEEGEFETAKKILNEERRVLLALRDSRVDSKTLRYAMNTCKRVGAGLDILYVSSSGLMDSILDRYQAELRDNDVPFRLIRKSGCLKQAIIDYTNTQKEVLFAVIESSDHLDVECAGKNRRLAESWKNLRCPLVVVSGAAGA